MEGEERGKEKNDRRKNGKRNRGFLYHLLV